MESVLKALTPLEELSDVEALDSHLRNMTVKGELSMQEIKRLTDELRGESTTTTIPPPHIPILVNHPNMLSIPSDLIEATRVTEVHALECASQSDMIENLQDQLVNKTEVK